MFEHSCGNVLLCWTHFLGVQKIGKKSSQEILSINSLFNRSTGARRAGIHFRTRKSADIFFPEKSIECFRLRSYWTRHGNAKIYQAFHAVHHRLQQALQNSLEILFYLASWNEVRKSMDDELCSFKYYLFQHLVTDLHEWFKSPLSNSNMVDILDNINSYNCS